MVKISEILRPSSLSRRFRRFRLTDAEPTTPLQACVVLPPDYSPEQTAEAVTVNIPRPNKKGSPVVFGITLGEISDAIHRDSGAIVVPSTMLLRSLELNETALRKRYGDKPFDDALNAGKTQSQVNPVEYPHLTGHERFLAVKPGWGIHTEATAKKTKGLGMLFINYMTERGCVIPTIIELSGIREGTMGALRLAHLHGKREVALPELSSYSGWYGIPLPDSLRQVMKGVRDHLIDQPDTTLNRVTLVTPPGMGLSFPQQANFWKGNIDWVLQQPPWQ